VDRPGDPADIDGAQSKIIVVHRTHRVLPGTRLVALSVKNETTHPRGPTIRNHS
jgi:hypothetical protein